MPADTAAFVEFLASFSSGWLANGIGEAQPYPTFYLIAGLLYAARAFASPIVSLALVIGGGAFVGGAAAYTFARGRGVAILGASALAVIVVANPWVYAKMVAGHVFMIFAYFMLVALVAEIDRAKPRTIALVVYGALTIVQIQFFFIAVVPFAVWCMRTRRPLPLVAMLLAFAPIAAGVVGDYGSLRDTPYMLVWQEQMSVPPVAGLMLMGYLFGYAHAFVPLTVLGILMVLVAATGIPGLRSARDRTIVLIAVAAFVVATGTKGPIAPLYAWAVLALPETGVYRELYDLIALGAIGYLVVIAAALARPRVQAASFVVACTAVGLLAVWCISPPAAQTVSAGDIPHVALPQTPTARVALLPAFQPIAFGDRGSGVDPDAFLRPDDATPINDVFPTFPVDVGLAFLSRDGDDSRLRALGVDRVIARPYLHSDFKQLDAFSLPFTQRRRVGTARAADATLPIMGVVAGAPPFVATGDDPRGWGRVDPDAGIVTLHAQNATLNFAAVWVDARLAFRTRPEWGTAYGGVATASRTPFVLPTSGRAVLAQSDADIRDQRGHVIATRTTELRWWPLDGTEHALTCSAPCALAALATHPVTLPPNGARPVVAPAPWTTYAPWAMRVTVPAHTNTETLRYAERFDPHWTLRGEAADHVMLAGDLNGWILGPTTQERTLLVTHDVAAVQAALEAVTWLFLIVVGAALGVGRLRNRRYPAAAAPDNASAVAASSMQPVSQQRPG
jgi:hypothetical protein